MMQLLKENTAAYERAYIQMQVSTFWHIFDFMGKKVAVILVNWNSFSVTFDCITSLQKMSYHDFDILVTDNGSTDGSGKQLKESFPEIILIESATNRGFTGGNNMGMQYAINTGYQYVILLNNDTFVKEDFLLLLTDYMDRNPLVGAIQPLIYWNHNRALVWDAGDYYNKFTGRAYSTNFNKQLIPSNNRVKQVDWITGCAFFTRVSVLKETGLLAENLFMYFEDVDLSFRIRKAGYPLVFHNESVIYHIAGMSNKNKNKGKEGYLNPIVHYINIRNRIWLLKRYTKPWYVPTVLLFNFFYIVAVMVYFVMRLRFAKLKTVVRAVKDGVKGKIICK